MALTTASALVFLFLIGLEVLGRLTNPYAGLIVFVLVPALFVLGLLLIPFGIWLDRRSGDSRARTWSAFDMKDPATQRMATFIAVATVITIAIIAMASYGAVEYTESKSFCGQVCHGVMHPEFIAHQNGLHARVDCVACHMDPELARS